jgi:uncharacterized protein (DUF58 family)
MIEASLEAIWQRVTHIPYRVRWSSTQHRLGQRQSHVRGGGLEFDQITEHQPGEAIRRINWAATARSGNSALLMNTYYEDHDLTVMLLVDLSASMDFGTRRVTKKHLTAELSASLVYSALAARDRIGLIGFTSDVVCYVPPRQSCDYQWVIPETILQVDSAGTRASFWAAASGLDQYVKRRALVFLMSDYLTDDMPELAKALVWLRKKHELISLHIRDPREIDIPTARACLVARDLETGQRATYNFLHRNQRHMRSLAQRRQEQLQAMMQQLAIAQVTVTPESDVGADMARLFRARPRRERR